MSLLINNKLFHEIAQEVMLDIVQWAIIFIATLKGILRFSSFMLLSIENIVLTHMMDQLKSLRLFYWIALCTHIQEEIARLFKIPSKANKREMYTQSNYNTSN